MVDASNCCGALVTSVWWISTTVLFVCCHVQECRMRPSWNWTCPQASPSSTSSTKTWNLWSLCSSWETRRLYVRPWRPWLLRGRPRSKVIREQTPLSGLEYRLASDQCFCFQALSYFWMIYRRLLSETTSLYKYSAARVDGEWLGYIREPHFSRDCK